MLRWPIIVLKKYNYPVQFSVTRVVCASTAERLLPGRKDRTLYTLHSHPLTFVPLGESPEMAAGRRNAGVFRYGIKTHARARINIRIMYLNRTRVRIMYFALIYTCTWIVYIHVYIKHRHRFVREIRWSIGTWTE